MYSYAIIIKETLAMRVAGMGGVLERAAGRGEERKRKDIIIIIYYLKHFLKN